MMKKKIEESMLILAYAFLLCLCAAFARVKHLR